MDPLLLTLIYLADLTLNFITKVFRAYLVDQSMDNLGTALRKGGVRDLLLFFPSTKRDQPNVITNHFSSTSVALPTVSEWWSKRALKEARDSITSELASKRAQGMAEAEELENEAEEIKTSTGGELGEKLSKEKLELSKSTLLRNNVEIIEFLNLSKKEKNLKEEDLIPIIWEGLMRSVDWTISRPDQIEAMALKEVNKNCKILESFTNNARSEINLINSIQVYCYEDTRIIKTFPNILKLLYNRDVVSDQAILYWAQKGAKPQGKGHFLKATEPLVKVSFRDVVLLSFSVINFERDLYLFFLSSFCFIHSVLTRTI